MTDAPWLAGRYRLTARAHMPPAPGQNAAMMEVGDEVVWAGKPGPHMHPLDAAAMVNVGRVLDEGGFARVPIGEMGATGIRVSPLHAKPRW